MPAEKTQKSWLKRSLWATLGLIALFLLVVVFLRVFITTDSGARFIENQVNKRSFGPIESIEISGLSGDPLKKISIENVILKDKNGDWLRLNNLDVQWKPLAYFKDHVWVENISITKTNVLRWPVLNSTESTKALPKLTLEDFQFDAMNLDESLIGQGLSLQFSGQFVAEKSGEVQAKINAAQLDVSGDVVILDFTRNTAGMMAGNFDIKGAAIGPIATLLKARDAVTGRGKISGTNASGSGDIAINFGETEAITSTVDWTPNVIIAKANMNLEDWPVFDTVRGRLGADLMSTLNVERGEIKAFTADINVPGLSMQATGNLPEDGILPARVNVDMAAEKISKFVSLPDGYSLGGATAKGRLDIFSPYAFDGRVSVNDLTSPIGTVSQINGPINVTRTTSNEYKFDVDITAYNMNPNLTLPIDWDETTRIQSTGSFIRQTNYIDLKTFKMASGEHQVIGKGALTTDMEHVDLSGQIAALLKTQGSMPDGIIKADIALFKNPNSLLAITTDGAFRPNSIMSEPTGGLIGDQIVFKARMSPVDQGLKISEASVIGEGAKLAIDGMFGAQLDLTGEAVLSAPLAYKSYAVEGGAEASFKLTGLRRSPALRVDATAGTVIAQSYVMKSVRLRTEINDLLDAPKGPLQLEAETDYGTLTASTKFASQSGVYIANDIELALGRLIAKGSLQVPEDRIAIGEVTLNLPERGGQYARASLALSNASGNQGVAITANAKQITIKGLNIDVLTAKASGSLASLTGNIAAQGQHAQDLISRRFTVDAPFTIKISEDDGIKATISPDSHYGDIAITARLPITATYASGELSINAPLAVLDGTVDVVYASGSEGEALKLTAKSLPVTLIPMSGNLADTRGRISGDVDIFLQSDSTLEGSGLIRLTDWRGFDVKERQGVTAMLQADINGGTVDIVLSGSSTAGFNTEGQLRLPLSPTKSLLGSRLNIDAPIKGNFSASGAAASVFGLITPSDAELGGSLSAHISIAGTVSKPLVDGEAGGQDIRFELPELGTRIRRGRGNLRFNNDSFLLNDFFVADSDDGTLTGAGEFKLGELGRPIGEMNITANRFRALDRKDIDAKVKGNITFISAPKDAKLFGDITINNAEVKQLVSGAVSVIEIDVEEINRPEQEDEIIIQRPKTPINLNMRVRAPRKIYIRSRGMDVEMALDATIKGTVSEPLFYGEANVVRGGYKLAGKTLEFESGTIIFDGDLTKARVDFKAVTDTQNLDASVTIKGTVDAPEIELSSIPERPQDEILSALLFGRSATELSTIEAAQLAGALAQFSGAGGGFDLLGGLRDAFGISQLSVNFNPDGSAQLVGGRYLAKDVYLEVFSGAGPDQTGAIIDWEVRKNIALRSRIRADNDQALSLKWKHDF